MSTTAKIDATTMPQLVSTIPKFQKDPKASALDNPPMIWEIADSTTGKVDTDKVTIFYARLRLDIPNRVSVADYFSPPISDPQKCWDFQSKTLEAVLERIVLDDTQRTHIIEKARELEEAHFSNLRGESIIKITELVAKRVQRTIDAYLASPDLQANSLAERFARRIIRDLEYLVKDPAKRWNDYEFHSMEGRETKGKQTREFILRNLRNKKEPGIIKWLLDTYASRTVDEESDYGLACADVTLSNALWGLNKSS